MKLCLLTSFYPAATLPFAHHLSEQDMDIDYYFLSQQGATNMETFSHDYPVSGNKIDTVRKDNPIYSYLSNRVNLYIVPYYLVKNRRYLIGFIPYYRNLIIIECLVDRIIAEQYDIIYCIVNEEHDALLCEKLKDRGLKNVIVAYHEIVKSHTEKEELKDCVKDTVTMGYPIVCYSNKTKEQLYRLTGNKDIHTIYFGPFETYKQFDTHVPLIIDKYILFIGNIQPYKGLPFLYDAIKQCGKDIDCKIVIAGSGYDSVLEKMKEDDRFIIINRFLEDVEFANLTRHASCVVCPYVSGSQSGITHTAMVYDVPVIATKVGAFPEFIEEGKNGYLVEYGDYFTLCKYIVNYLKNESFNYIVPQKLMWKEIVNTFLLLIDEVWK